MEFIPRAVINIPLVGMHKCVREVSTNATKILNKASMIKPSAGSFHFKMHFLCTRDVITSKRLILSQMTYQQYLNFSSEGACMKNKRRKKQPSLNNTSRNVLLEEQKLILKPRQISYVFDKDVAKKLVATIMAHRVNPQAPVLEIDCGPGLVSREFLKQGVSKVAALETNKDFSDLLLELQNKVGKDKFQYFNWPFLDLSFKFGARTKNNDSANNYNEYESTVVELLRSSPSLQDKEVPYSLFITGGKLENYNFVFYVLRNLPNDDVILSYGRVEFFFLIHPKFKAKIEEISGVKKRSLRFCNIHVLVYLLYDLDVLEEYDANNFWPPFSSAKSTFNKHFDPTKRLLVRMQLKKDIDQILPLEHHVPFFIFLRQLYKKKMARLIPSMELIMPGCGLRMLAEGFTMMDRIISCKPAELLKLYKLMVEWPEYVNSPLRSYVMAKIMGGLDDMEKGSLIDMDKDHDHKDKK